MSLGEIVNVANENNNWFVLDELNKYTEIKSILKIKTKAVE